MPSVWKTVRVFISSTFRDMHAERDHLIKVVFPALRERLEKYRIYLDDIDLRWGVTKEQAENDQVLDLCLQQIDECRPFFIGILGERYGWVPTQFPASTVSNQGWVQYHTGKSVTDLEMVYGVFTKPPMRSRAFFYFRDPAALVGMPDDIRSSTFAETEPERIGQLTDLKQRIRQNGYPLMEPYPARWDAQAYDRPGRSSGRLVGLEAFGEQVREQLWEAIKAEHHLPDAPPPETALDPLAVELGYHERFMESRLRVHVLRQQINDALLAFAENDTTVPCLVTGPSGSGKSASLARFVLDYQRANPDALVVPHFVGASPRSTNLREMVRRFCQILKARLGLAEEVPEEVTKLAVTFREFIGKVPPDTRVLFVIDALNQLDETDHAQNLGWLPVQFPPQVKVVVSCISDSGKVEPALEAFARRQHVLLAVGPLDEKERRQIIQAVPSLSAKALDHQQIEQLLANPATANPLFLLVALEELRGFGSYERLNERIAAFPRDGDTVTAIFTQVIERLEEEFNPDVVRSLLLLLASARRGLSDRELLSLVEGPTVPTTGSQSDLFPVLRQLRSYLLRRGLLNDFYHRNLFQAVHRRYLDTLEQEQAGHTRLAVYFDSQPLWLQTDDQAVGSPPTPTPQPNMRKVDELPWQWLQAKQGEQLNNLLTDLAFLEAKTAAGLVFDIVTDMRETVAQLPRGESQQVLGLLEEAIRQDIHFISHHRRNYPQSLIQSIVNRLWPIASGKSSPDGNGESEGIARALKLLLTRWEDEANTRGLIWLKLDWLDRNMVYGGPLRWQLKMPERPPEVVSFSPTGNMVAGASAWRYSNRPNPPSSWSAAYELNVWSSDTGELIHQLFPDPSSLSLTGPPRSLPRPNEPAVEQEFQTYFARLDSGNPDHWSKVAYKWYDALIAGDIVDLCWIGEDLLLAGCRGGRVFAWDARSGGVAGMIQLSNVDRTLEIRDWNETIASSLEGLDKDEFAVGTAFGTVHVYHSHRGLIEAKQMAVDPENGYYAEKNKIHAMAYHPSSRRLAVACLDWVIRVIELDSWQIKHHLRGHQYDVIGISWSPDGRHLASVSFDKTLRIWDVVNECECCPPVSHPMDTIAVNWGFQADQVMTTWNRNGVGGSVRVWNTADGSLVHEFGGVPTLHESLAVSPNKGLVATGSLDGFVRVWNPASAGISIHPPEHHRAVIRSADAHLVRQEIATLALDGIAIWSTRNGELLRRINRDWSDWLNWTLSLRYSPNGRYLAAIVGNRINMIDPDNMTFLWSVQADGKDIARFYFSSDSLRLLTDDQCAPNAQWVDPGSGVLVWDVTTGACVDRSSRVGLDAEDRLREYEAEKTAAVHHDEPREGDQGGKGKSAKWRYYKETVAELSFTKIVLVDETDQETHLHVSGMVRHLFALEDFGQWVAVCAGGAAPRLLTVQFPSRSKLPVE